MDSITHILSASLWAEPISPPHASGVAYARWRERAAIVLAALLPDADSITGWFSLALYERYHRVATHSLVGLVVIAALAAALARAWPERWLPPFLRTKAEGRPIVAPAYHRLFAFALLAVCWHFVGDWITDWGIWPFWPFAELDYSLSLANSLDPYLLAITVVSWAGQHFALTKGRKKTAWAIAPLWLATCVLYLWLHAYLQWPVFI